MADGRRWQVVRDELRHEAWTCRVGSRACGTGRTAGSVRLDPSGDGEEVPCDGWFLVGTGGNATVPDLRARGADAPGAGVLRSPLAAYRVS